MPPGTVTAPPPDMPSDSDILFHWKASSSGVVQRLIIAWVVAISIHGLCFYIFQVQDPQSPHTVPQTFSVTYLSAEDPVAGPILQKIDDYYAAYDGTLLADSELNMPLRSLDYEAHYESVTPELMPLPEREAPPLTSLGPEIDAMVLPPLPAWTPPADQPMEGGIALTEGLELVLPEGWSERYRGSSGTDWEMVKREAGLGPGEGRSTWNVLIRRDGKVDQVRSQTAPADNVVEAALRNLTFTPRSSADSIWLQVHLLW